MLVSHPVEQIPVRMDAHGRMRIGETNVLLDVVIYAFRVGSTPENITQQYPSLSLEDVYLALGYYLRHRQDVDAYIWAQETEAVQMQQQRAPEHTPQVTKAMLLARLAQQQTPTDA